MHCVHYLGCNHSCYECGVVRKKHRIKLIPIEVEDTKERRWLHHFILKNHSTPKIIMPSEEDLRLPNHRYFRAFTVGTKKELIGISSFEIRTRFLAETQKTVVVKSRRGQGWGKAISLEIENEVRRQGFTKVRTTIYSDNLKMIQIKLEQGYTIEGFHPDHEAPGVHEYSLGKVFKGKSGH